MSISSFTTELTQYGPDAPPRERVSLAEAEQYCRRLSRSHYENFSVVSWLLPKRLHQHFYNVYAYCRWADDLADETSSPEESLRLLAWWQTELEQCYQNKPSHPIFVALLETIKRFGIPQQPFANLLTAFRQDQQQTRYENFGQLLGYCENSANPVGHLVLYLGECFDQQNVILSDSICTGLQLANFWQDVARDWQQGRVYLPLDSMTRHHYTLKDMQQNNMNEAFRAVLAEEVARAEVFLESGKPLVDLVPRELQIDIALFIEGGLAILQAIRKIQYNVWQTRPTVSKFVKMKLFAKCWLKYRFCKPPTKAAEVI